MNGRYFLDTNVFVYTFDASAPAKRKRAQTLVADALVDSAALISYQVVQEFINVATRKFEVPLTYAESRAYLTDVLNPLCEVYPTYELYLHALDVAAETKFGFYDALIVAAALEARCETLYSEDLQDGFRIQGLTVRNPFAGPARNR
jgi:predicted nucleic acid-binding protein